MSYKNVNQLLNYMYCGGNVYNKVPYYICYSAI